MFTLVSSKAQSRVAASSPETRLHSMEMFNLRGEKDRREESGVGRAASVALRLKPTSHEA